MSYQYFITVVPTYVSTYSYRGSTFQYSVSEQSREIAHDKAGGSGSYVKICLSMLAIPHEAAQTIYTKNLNRTLESTFTPCPQNHHLHTYLLTKKSGLDTNTFSTSPEFTWHTRNFLQVWCVRPESQCSWETRAAAGLPDATVWHHWGRHDLLR